MKKRSSKNARFSVRAELENPVLGIRPVLDADLTRDHLENGASDLRDL